MDNIERYMDDDTWVRVKLSNPAEFCFIRIIGKTVGSYGQIKYEFNSIPIVRMSRGGVCHCTEHYKEMVMTDTSSRADYNIHLWKPLELLSTDEIFCIDQ